MTSLQQGDLFGGENSPHQDDALERWLDAPPVADACSRCGVELRAGEQGDCDDCRRELMVREQRTAKAVDKGIQRAAKAAAKPVWSDATITLPNPETMPEPLAAAYHRQLQRYGEQTLYCAHCRLPSGDWQTCYACKEHPQRTPGSCVRCQQPCRAEYATCWACRQHPDREPGTCVSCGGRCLPAYATCWKCKN